MKTILVIEDNEEILDNVTELLELGGYQVVQAKNGLQGIALAIQKKPDLILCDIMMPEANGHQVFNELKKNTSTANIPFVFLTASAEKKEVELGLGIGANAYIKKPFDPYELYHVIKVHLGV